MAPRIAAEIAALPPGDPQIATQTGEPASPADRAAWLAEARPLALMRAFCDAACPADPPSCVAAAYRFHANPEVSEFGSPIETLVSSDAWHASARGRASVLRHPLPADDGLRAHLLAEVAARDACFGAELAASAARFGR